MIQPLEMAVPTSHHNLQIYRVGGFVRDRILGIKATDCDYVVIGSSKEEMLALGFQQIGKFFPVFLHPKTHEEYALARTERKTGHGHTGFSYDSSQQVTLIEDLSRRDITINAIAEDMDGNLIDPFGGVKDLNNHVIRHVSDAFTDDPLRVLRVARFAAKLDFKVAPETITLLENMAINHEGYSLSRERIIKELDTALSYNYPSKFFTILNSTNNLEIFFPALAYLAKANDLFNKFINELDKCIDKNMRYMLIGIYLTELKLYDKIEEFSLHKKTQSLIRLTQTLHQMLSEKSLADDKLLTYYKKLYIWRNFDEFKRLCDNYIKWLKDTNVINLYDKLKKYLEIAIQLKALDLSELLNNKSVSKAGLPKLIYDLQIKAIHELREKNA